MRTCIRCSVPIRRSHILPTTRQCLCVTCEASADVRDAWFARMQLQTDAQPRAQAAVIISDAINRHVARRNASPFVKLFVPVLRLIGALMEMHLTENPGEPLL